MRPFIRIGFGIGLVVLWMFWISPRLHDQLLQRRSVRSNTISAPTLRTALLRADTMGTIAFITPEERAKIDEDVAAIESLLQLEGAYIRSIWAQLPQPERMQALEDLHSGEVPRPQPNPRFVDPYTPVLILAILNEYGYRRSPVGTSDDLPTSLSYRDQLLVSTSLVNEKQLSDEITAQILDAAMHLDKAQRERVEREHMLAMSLPPRLLDMAVHMHNREPRAPR